MEKCVRRRIAGRMGGADKLPSNMMPNGLPMTGTDTKEWSKEIQDALKEEKEKDKGKQAS